MSEPQKKIIPKFKKKLQGFLSDESGRITKEDILKVGMLAMGISSMIPSASAATCGHSNSGGTHSSSVTAATHGNAPVANHTNIASTHSNTPFISGISAGTFGDAPNNIRSAPVTHVVNGHVNYAAGGVALLGSPGHANSQWANHSNGLASGHSSAATPAHTNSAVSNHSSAPVAHGSGCTHGNHSNHSAHGSCCGGSW